jgi:hypothetical protein
MKIWNSFKAWHPTQKQIASLACWLEILDQVFPTAAALVLFYVLIHLGLASIPLLR